MASITQHLRRGPQNRESSVHKANTRTHKRLRELIGEEAPVAAVSNNNTIKDLRSTVNACEEVAIACRSGLPRAKRSRWAKDVIFARKKGGTAV